MKLPIPKYPSLLPSGHTDLQGSDSGPAQTTCYNPWMWWFELPSPHQQQPPSLSASLPIKGREGNVHSAFGGSFQLAETPTIRAGVKSSAERWNQTCTFGPEHYRTTLGFNSPGQGQWTQAFYFMFFISIVNWIIVQQILSPLLPGKNIRSYLCWHKAWSCALLWPVEHGQKKQSISSSWGFRRQGEILLCLLKTCVSPCEEFYLISC